MDIEKKHLDYIGEKYRLTDREKDIVRLIFKGLPSNEDMSKELNIALGTIDVHLNSIYKKTLKSRKHELIALFLEDFIMQHRNINAKKIIISKNHKSY